MGRYDAVVGGMGTYLRGSRLEHSRDDIGLLGVGRKGSSRGGLSHGAQGVIVLDTVCGTLDGGVGLVLRGKLLAGFHLAELSIEIVKAKVAHLIVVGEM